MRITPEFLRQQIELGKLPMPKFEESAWCYAPELLNPGWDRVIEERLRRRWRVIEARERGIFLVGRGAP
jgi:hypothetical protein